jgi:uncharacterized membrane protein YphA (DoxX/SURF4 family)
LVRNPLSSVIPAPADLGLLLARVPLGAWLVMAGFSKFTADGGVARFAKQGAGAMPDWVPAGVGGYYLTGVPYAEILLGAAIALGVAARLGGFLAAVLLGSLMVVLTGVRAAMPMMPMNPGVLLLGVAALVCLAGPGSLSMDRFMWGSSRAGEPKPDRARR